VIWLLVCITDILVAIIGKRDSYTVTASFWEWAAMEHQQFLTSYLASFMFRLVPDIHLSHIGSLYSQKQQRHAPCRMLKLSVKGALTIVSCGSWVIYVPVGCRYPFIRYWQPLQAKTTATCSLPHPENERQQSVNSFSCCIFGNQGIARIFAFITELLTSLIGKNTIYQR